MAQLKAPSVTISFSEIAATAIERGERGVIGMILTDTTIGTYTIYDTTDIPSTLSESNQKQIKLALKGYQTAPRKILVDVIASKADIASALKYFGSQYINYLVYPNAETDEVSETIASWIKSQRTKGYTYRAVLPNYTADDEYVVNVACGATDEDGTKYTAEQLCSRIAGIICGTPTTMRCTYAPVPEMAACDRVDDLDAAVTAGKLMLMWDGSKVKICRGVTSLTTTSSEKGESFQKIKLVDAMAEIQYDIRTTIQDSYIGKYVNSYDNKCLLISAINAYFDQLRMDSMISAGRAEIDVDEQRIYLKSKGSSFIITDSDGNEEEVDLAEATDQQIKEANTGSKVFVRADVKLLDAIEDVQLKVYL